MARKRMFDMEIVDTDTFLEMPHSSQNLYFHLSMRADDDGFVSSPKKIMKMLECNIDDLNLLIAKSYLIHLKNGTVVIRHWRINNYIQKDRYKETLYKEEKAFLRLDENGVYNLDTECIHRIEENREEENRIDNSTTTPITRTRDLNNLDIFSYLEQAWGRTLSPYEYELLQNWENNEITRYAIKESVKCNARSIKYVERIVENLKAKGIKTEAEATKDSDDFKSKQVELKSGRGTSKSKFEEDREKIRKWAEQGD